MQIKIGTDIIEVERIKTSIQTYGNKFLNKIYTEEEIEYCNKNADTKYQHFAARFAAKEAIFKAISELTQNKLIWKNIEIINEKSGRPTVKIHNLQPEIAKQISNIDLSLSHIKDTAVATAAVIIEL